jgi:hypothetical protein
MHEDRGRGRTVGVYMSPVHKVMIETASSTWPLCMERSPVRRSSRAVDNIELSEGELIFLCELLDCRLELALLQRRELVEEGRNDVGIDGEEKEYECAGQSPGVDVKVVAACFDDPYETCEDGHACRQERAG